MSSSRYRSSSGLKKLMFNENGSERTRQGSWVCIFNISVTSGAICDVTRNSPSDVSSGATKGTTSVAFSVSSLGAFSERSSG